MAKGLKAASNVNSSNRRPSKFTTRPKKQTQVQPSKSNLLTWAQRGAISVRSHIDHVFYLIQEALDVKFEHGWYQLYDWALNFNALRRGSDECRLSVYPQAKLVFDPSKKAVVGRGDINNTDQGDEDEQDHEHKINGNDAPPSGYDDVDSCADVEAMLDEVSLDGSQQAEDHTSAFKLEDHKEILPRRSVRFLERGKTQAPIRPPDSSVSSVPSEKEKEIIRYPDFSVTITLPNKPMGIHTLWELKLFPEDAFKGVEDEDAKFTLVNNIFTAMRAQVLQQAICAFSKFPFQKTLYVFCVVGYFLKRLILHRCDMPEEDYDFKNASDEELEKFIRVSGRIFHLLNEDRSDYSRRFKTYWTHALSCAVKEIGNCSLRRESATTRADINLYEVPSDPKQKTNEKGKGRAVPKNAKRAAIASMDDLNSDREVVDSTSDGEAFNSGSDKEAEK
ncbi:hypothetical protein EW026_g846 [Hermanssonia centrifuga]|uniref:Uncharacterized protein n=1 Tax=Hermanssonia centrifuga TaxID=98765 RepID=A0A4S4KTE8_9APHY|nr:hypothetical protein EW026_g846 [Hermanssonia centrifuga]